MNRSSRREEALTSVTQLRMSLLTSAATRFMAKGPSTARSRGLEPNLLRTACRTSSRRGLPLRQNAPRFPAQGEGLHIRLVQFFGQVRANGRQPMCFVNRQMAA